MPVYRDRAVVLRHQDLAGADKLVTFLTRDHGKVKTVAKGARRPKSRFAGSLELLSHVEMVYFLQPERPALARLNGCEAVEVFDSLRADYDRLIRGLYLVELADAFLEEGVPLQASFENLVGALGVLNEGADGDIVRWGYTWRLLSDLGYSPSLDACIICRQETNLVVFNPGLGGCLCEGCRLPERDGLSLHPGARESLRLLGSLPWYKVGRLTLTGILRPEVGCIVEAYLRQHLGRQLKTAAFLEKH